MARCRECNKTIKLAHLYHKGSVVIAGVKAYNMPYIPMGYWCCMCLDHDTGQCETDKQVEQYNNLFKRSLVHSMGGVTRQGFLEGNDI